MPVSKSYSIQPSSVRGWISQPWSCCAETKVQRRRRKIATARIKRKRIIGRGEISRMSRDCQAQDSMFAQGYQSTVGTNLYRNETRCHWESEEERMECLMLSFLAIYARTDPSSARQRR